MIKRLQTKYLNSHLKHSVLDIKSTYETLLESHTGKELEYLWFNEWFEKVAFKHADDEPHIRHELLALWNEYSQLDITLDKYLNNDLVYKYDELSIAYFQSYMWYKIKGIEYERHIIKYLSEKTNGRLKETNGAVDRIYKIDAILNGNIAIQIKNYNFYLKAANDFYKKAKKYNKVTRYMYLGIDGMREYINGVWTPVDIKEVIK